MSGNEKHINPQERPQAEDSALFEPVIAALAQLEEAERYRLIAALLGQLAQHTRPGDDLHGSAEQLETLTKRVQALHEEKASLDDALAALRVDLAHRDKRLEAEQTRAEELQRIVDDQRVRSKAIQKEQADLQAQVTALNAELHRVQVDNETLRLKLQRAERDAVGQDRIETLEKSNRDLSARLTELGGEMERLRTDKDARIEQLEEQLRHSQSGAGASADALLAALWRRLASAKPALADGHVQPTVQAAERLVDALIELVRFADDFDKGMRVFVGNYTKHHPSVKVPWDVYAKRDDVYKTAQQTVAPQGGKPVGLLKMRLRFLYSWTQASMIGCDSAIESIASELYTHLMGPVGAGSDPNRKIKDYLRGDGHELFVQHIRELRGQKLAEFFGRGG